ncbi:MULTISPECIES: hypothetical protein [Moorena]|uniref:hypothetical protein n=1 Tax=Moorena TaxID=1155738 RepID=UPI001055D7F8|nr:MULTISPECIES: hypothetical protein [Moorena]NEP32191.1 hypothetical protein [Moorena sp. SIO3B2]
MLTHYQMRSHYLLSVVGGHCFGEFGQVGEWETGNAHPTKCDRTIFYLWLVGIALVNSGR